MPCLKYNGARQYHQSQFKLLFLQYYKQLCLQLKLTLKYSDYSEYDTVLFHCIFSHKGHIEANRSPDMHLQDRSNSYSENLNKDTLAVLPDICQMTMKNWSEIQRSDDNIGETIPMIKLGNTNKRRLLETGNHEMKQFIRQCNK